MFKSLFGKSSNKEQQGDSTPRIMGLGLGGSFDVDKLAMRLILDELTIDGFSATQIIKAAGLVELNGTWVYRFYTDDDAWLQVVAEGGQEAEHVVDVKLFHFFDTLDISDQSAWESLLREEIGRNRYDLNGKEYHRVWTASGDYHSPVHMKEKTYDDSGDYSLTDQFTMLFERPLSDGRTESLFLSAEETEEVGGYLSHSLVQSTGLTLTPSQITIHG